MFAYEHVVKLHETDGYGILFFANQPRMCHDALQECWRAIGFPMLPTRGEMPALPVVVHVESDYSATVRIDDRLRIEIMLDAIGTTSFTLRYRLVNQRGVEVGRARTVHCSVDPASGAKMPLPEALRSALARI